MDLTTVVVVILLAVPGWVFGFLQDRTRRLERKEAREGSAMLLEGQHVLKKAVATQAAVLEKLLHAPTVSPEVRAEAEAAIKMGDHAVATVIPAPSD